MRIKTLPNYIVCLSKISDLIIICAYCDYRTDDKCYRVIIWSEKGKRRSEYETPYLYNDEAINTYFTYENVMRNDSNKWSFKEYDNKENLVKDYFWLFIM